MRISDWSSDVCSSDLFLKLMTEKNASDMFQTTGAPVYIKVEGKLYPLGNTGLPQGMVKKIAYSLMDEGQVPQFERRSEERRVGKEWGSTWRYRWEPYHNKKTKCTQLHLSNTHN